MLYFSAVLYCPKLELGKVLFAHDDLRNFYKNRAGSTVLLNLGNQTRSSAVSVGPVDLNCSVKMFLRV